MVEQLLSVLRDYESGKVEESAVVSLADQVLITGDGRCNWSAISEVKNNGFNVLPLERDSFGWLVGGIKTRRGVVAFG
jgi:heterodisulfide reductase subunit A-like polyferredoxin